MINCEKVWFSNKRFKESNFYEKGSRILYSKLNKYNIFGRETHRVNGPAIIDNNENYYWYKYNNIHRIDGPAYSTLTGKGWYLYGTFINNEEKYWND